MTPEELYQFKRRIDDKRRDVRQVAADSQLDRVIEVEYLILLCNELSDMLAELPTLPRTFELGEHLDTQDGSILTN